MTLSPYKIMSQNIYFYFYMLLNSSVETDLQFLIVKLSLLSSEVFFVEMALLLNSDHLVGGCLKDVWDGFSLSKLRSALLVGFSISTNSSPNWKSFTNTYYGYQHIFHNILL